MATTPGTPTPGGNNRVLWREKTRLWLREWLDRPAVHQQPLDALSGDTSEELTLYRLRLEYERHRNQVENEKLLTTIRNALGKGLPTLMYVETVIIFSLVVASGIHGPGFNNPGDNNVWGFTLDPVTLRIIAAATLAQVAALVAIIVSSLYPKGGVSSGSLEAPPSPTPAEASSLPPGVNAFLDHELQQQAEESNSNDGQ